MQAQALQQHALHQHAMHQHMPLTPGVQAELAYADMLASVARPPAEAPRAVRRRATKPAAPDIKHEIARCLDRRGRQGEYA
jgi:hypothetical protein